MLTARLSQTRHHLQVWVANVQSGRSSGVEHNLAKVGVEGSNPFARSSREPPAMGSTAGDDRRRLKPHNVELKRQSFLGPALPARS